jgi:hypothetical protein
MCFFVLFSLAVANNRTCVWPWGSALNHGSHLLILQMTLKEDDEVRDETVIAREGFEIEVRSHNTVCGKLLSILHIPL